MSATGDWSAGGEAARMLVRAFLVHAKVTGCSYSLILHDRERLGELGHVPRWRAEMTRDGREFVVGDGPSAGAAVVNAAAKWLQKIAEPAEIGQLRAWLMEVQS